MEVKGRREDSGQLYKQKEEQQVELIDRILSDGNIEAAIHAVKSNRGAAGIDKMTVDVLEGYFAEHGKEIKEQIRAKKYQPQPVKRVYIPKANGKQRPLGIPTVVDRVIQQAMAQVLSKGYEVVLTDVCGLSTSSDLAALGHLPQRGRLLEGWSKIVFTYGVGEPPLAAGPLMCKHTK